MKNIKIISFFLLLSGISFGEKININDNTFSIDVLNSNKQQTTISYEFGSFERSAVEIDGKTYYRLFLSGGAVTFEKGAPELPKISRSIIIPDDAKVEVNIIEKDYTEYHFPIAPSKGMISRSQNPDDVPYTFSDVYKKDSFYPQLNSGLGEPYILRDFRGITVTAFPFQYNPKTQILRVYHQLVLEINTVGRDNINIKSRLSEGYNTYFEGLYSGHFLNFDEVRYDSIDEQGRMIVISYGAFMAEMQPFVDWKNQKGIRCDIYDVADIGSNANSIKSFIQGEYFANNDLVFVQLVGDAAQIPPMNFNNEDSDPSYSLLEGEDNYPEIFIGRFSAENTSHVETQVERTIHYERDIVDGDWLAKGIGIGSEEGAGEGDEGEADWQHQDVIREKLMTFGYTQVDQVYGTNGGNISDILNGLDEGRGIINYCGHGSATSWSTTGFSNTNVNQLQNDYKLPFINSVACVNGNFSSTTCFAESWLRATNFSTGAPTGAMAMYASTINQSWAPPMRGQDHAIDLLVGWDYSNNVELDQKNTIGGLWFNGSCNMMDVYHPGNPEDGTGEEMFLTWTIFGDASLQVRTDTPQAMTISHTGTLLIGMSSYDVSVGFEDALISLTRDGALLASGFTDASGQITLQMEEPQESPGTAVLTVTAFNKITSVENINVVAPDGPYLIISGVTPHTEDDEIIEYGEEVLVDVTITNVGVEPATNVTATFNSDDIYITPGYCAGFYDTIEPNQSITVNGACAFLVSNDVTNDHAFVITAEITADQDFWAGEMNFTAYSPVVDIGSVTISNDDNGNGRLDPGETADLVVSLVNDGGAEAEMVQSVLSTLDSYITINSSSADVAMLNAYSNENVTFNVTVSEETEIGHSAVFTVDVSADNDYTASGTFALSVGLCLEDFETGTFAMYPWSFSGNANWMITNTAYEGVYASQSMDINDNQTAGMEVTLNVTSADNISFYYKVSSEASSYSFYDGLKFYIDGVEQGDGWQGEIDWTEASFPVTQGEHTFSWIYSKDGTVSSGEDCAWIDYIIFPPVSPPAQPDIAVNPTELTLTVDAGETATAQVTITNEGTTGLGYTVETTSNWLTIFPVSGIVNPNQSQVLTVTADAENLSEGTHTGAIIITSNDPDEGEVEISITFMVGPSEITINTTHLANWNMVGLPVDTENAEPQQVYPQSINNTLYSFTESGYSLETTLTPGLGYWLRFNEVGEDTLIGREIESIAIALREGWNMISGSSMANSGWIDENNIIIPNTLYGFGESGYYNASSLEPGSGYWLRASQEGEIILTGTEGTAKLIEPTPLHANQITINGTTLYFGITLSEEERLSYSLPPTPPLGAPDVRFIDDMKVSADGGTIILQQGNPTTIITYAITRPPGDHMKWTLTNPSTDEAYELEGKGAFTVPTTTTFHLQKVQEIPTEFALSQNYPNPFNPETVIRYQLPVISDVQLTVYDLMGRVVNELVSGRINTGTHKVIWNGTDAHGNPVASGMYLYQLKTDSFIKTRKLLLLK